MVFVGDLVVVWCLYWLVVVTCLVIVAWWFVSLWLLDSVCGCLVLLLRGGFGDLFGWLGLVIVLWILLTVLVFLRLVCVWVLICCL